MLLKKTSFEMEVEAVQELLQGGVITNMTPGGRARSLIAVLTQRCGRVMEALDMNTAMAFVTSAAGYFLDLLGNIVGISRRDAEACYATKEDRAVKFYASTGVLGDWLPSLVIPAGTTVEDSTGTIQYAVSEATIFPADATETYVPVTATDTGTQYRVGKDILTSHSLNDPNILVTNPKGITNGDNLETDNNYRYRILNHRFSVATANTTALRLAALSAPGVADVIIRRHFQGPGTVDILLLPIGNRITEAMIRSVDGLVSRVSASGDYITVRGPRYVYITIDTRIDFTRDTPESEKNTVREAVRKAQIDYLDDIPIGGLLVIQELRARSQEASGRILDHEILCLGIHGRPQILRNYRLFEDELFLPDPDVDSAIKVF